MTESDDRLVQEPSASTARKPRGASQEAAASATPNTGSGRWLKALHPLPSVTTWAGKNKEAATAILFAFLIVKVLVISRGDIPTALAILHTAGLVTIVVGGLLSGLPILAAAMLTATAYRLADSPTLPGAALFSTVLAVCFFVAPVWIVIFSMLLGLTVSWASYHRPWRRAGRAGRALDIVAWTVLALVGAVLVEAALYTVWLPHERLTVSRPSSLVVGYVLDDGGGWLSMLQSGTRRIVRYRTEDVTVRTLCSVTAEQGSLVRQSPWQYLTSVGVIPHSFGPLPAEACSVRESRPRT
jgi:hypothetical protein